MAQDENILEVLPQAQREAIRNQLTQPQKDAHDILREKFDKVRNSTRGRNDVNLEVLDSYESMWLKMELERKNTKNEMIGRNASREAIDKTWNSIEEQRTSAWLKPAQAKYKLGGEMAFHALYENEKPTGIVEGITKNVFDKNDKGIAGGWQIGGILGALGGVLLGMQGGALMGGGWWSIITVVGGALLGSWLGNKAGDSVSGMFQKDAPPPASEPSRGQGQSQQIDNGTPEAERIKHAKAAYAKKAEKQDEAKEDGVHVDNENSGQLSKPPVSATPVRLPGPRGPGG